MAWFNLKLPFFTRKPATTGTLTEGTGLVLPRLSPSAGLSVLPKLLSQEGAAEAALAAVVNGDAASLRTVLAPLVGLERGKKLAIANELREAAAPLTGAEGPSAAARQALETFVETSSLEASALAATSASTSPGRVQLPSEVTFERGQWVGHEEERLAQWVRDYGRTQAVSLVYTAIQEGRIHPLEARPWMNALQKHHGDLLGDVETLRFTVNVMRMQEAVAELRGYLANTDPDALARLFTPETEKVWRFLLRDAALELEQAAAQRGLEAFGAGQAGVVAELGRISNPELIEHCVRELLRMNPSTAPGVIHQVAEAAAARLDTQRWLDALGRARQPTP